MSNKEYDEIVCHCNVKENAELIAKIMDYDVDGKVCTDVAEVKHGEWQEVNRWECSTHSVTDMKCSVCHHYASLVLPHQTTCTYDFCPFCGADMRKRVFICCKNCKHREKYTNHCSVLDRDILLTDYCSMSVFEERDDIPDTKNKGEIQNDM